MIDERAQMRLRAVNVLRALRLADPGRVITAAELNMVIDAIIEALII